MQWIFRFFISVVGILVATHGGFSQQFVCDGSFYISLTDPAGRATEVVTTESENGVVTFTPFIPSQNIEFNGLAYNTVDNYIYAVERGSDRILRFFSDNTPPEVVGEEGGGIRWNATAADCSPDGHFAVMHRRFSSLIYLNVMQAPEEKEMTEFAKVQLQWNEASGNSGVVKLEIDDFAFDPRDPYTIYTFQRDRNSYPHKRGSDIDEPEKTRGTLLKIDGNPNSPDFGKVSAVGNGIDNEIVRTIGALFFDATGNLYGYASAVYPINLDRLVAIDKNTGTAELVGVGPNAIGSDGCSCPYTLTLSMNSTQQTVVCQETVEYEIALFNSFGRSVEGVVYHHELPQGMTIVSISEDFPGTMKAGSGEGANVLTLENISLPKNSEVTFTLQVNVGNQPGSFSHQAELQNVPKELGSTLRSDDVTTNLPNDPSVITVQGLDWSDSKIEIEKAEPCSEELGDLRIANAQVEVGASYYISYKYNGVEQEVREIIGNESWELVVSGLSEGTYSEITILTEPEGGCSYTLDGSWTIEPSLSPLSIALNSNSPICETESIQLEVQTEEAVFHWTGPNSFYSEELSPIVEEATVTLSGYYYFHRQLAACELIDSVEVTVLPSPEIDIGIDTTVQRGDEIQLSLLSSSQNIATYQWTPDENISCTNCASPWVDPLETTEYEVTIITEDGCISSDRIVVEVLDPVNDIAIPNAFSPNDDGLNDVFYPIGDKINTRVIRMDVHNRWGELIFRQENFPVGDESYGWDGTHRNKKAVAGAYLYRIDAILPSGKEQTYQGKIFLIL